jgi:hypothetical protein
VEAAQEAGPERLAGAQKVIEIACAQPERPWAGVADSFASGMAEDELLPWLRYCARDASVAGSPVPTPTRLTVRAPLQGGTLAVACNTLASHLTRCGRQHEHCTVT